MKAFDDSCECSPLLHSNSLPPPRLDCWGPSHSVSFYVENKATSTARTKGARRYHHRLRLFLSSLVALCFFLFWSRSLFDKDSIFGIQSFLLPKSYLSLSLKHENRITECSSGNRISVAILSNSHLFVNDLPRLLEELSGNCITQNSVMRGGGSLQSLIDQGSGMYPQFRTENAIIGTTHCTNNSASCNNILYDYGACTVQQLLTGIPAYNVSGWRAAYSSDKTHDMNPCAEDPVYADYIARYFQHNPPLWDFILFNDYSRNPAHADTRELALALLEKYYVPWFQECNNAIPVLLWTYAYSINSTSSNMQGLEDVANFTSLTGVGIRAYANLLAEHLPPHQKPLIAPVALAFLTVYDENRTAWHQLFHQTDHLHPSPQGTFLQACVIHYTLLGRMPDKTFTLHRDSLASLWHRARMMQHAWDPPDQMLLDHAEAEYLYNVAERVAKHGYIPKSYIDYQNGEVAYEG